MTYIDQINNRLNEFYRELYIVVSKQSFLLYLRTEQINRIPYYIVVDTETCDMKKLEDAAVWGITKWKYK